MNYYNEYDKGAAQWLRELISTGEIPAGHVDERSIVDVRPSDLAGYVQCHFFAGIGGWSYALKLAGWPGDRPVWTGSCPCQPFSTAGKQRGTEDERHLWPVFHRLIADCRPPVVFGEQVASKLGREWLAGVRSDLEGLAYAVGAADLCAAGVGAPHLRQRLYWVADSEGMQRPSGGDHGRSGRQVLEGIPESRDGCDAGVPGGVEYAQQPRLEGHGGDGYVRNESRRFSTITAGPASTTSVPRFWDNAIGIHCADGKARRVEPTIFPLAHGFSESLACVFQRQKAVCEEIIAYATSNKTDPSQVLRMVREALFTGEGWEASPTGVCVEFPTPKVLLALLLGVEAARCSASDCCGSKAEGSEAVERAMRCLRYDSRPERPPRRWKPEEQHSRKSPATLFELSLVLARHAEAYAAEVLDANAALGRVASLRGAGNAIVPQVAAEFIGAYLDTLGGVALDSENLL